MKVRILRSDQESPDVLAEKGRADHTGSESYAGWQPSVVVGASSPGGLMLPSAESTPSGLYGPRSVWTDGRRLVVCDTGNHRVLIWHELPTVDGAPADVVLGQPDHHTEGPNAGGRGPERGMSMPTGVLVTDERLVVADAWHHRVLIWDEVPQSCDQPPDHVLFQPDFSSVSPNAGGAATGSTAYWPFGIAVIDGRFHVADTNNRRVLIWDASLPDPGEPAQVVLGQPTPQDREENRGGAVAANSFRWPHALTGTGDGGLLVADAGNHRVLRWRTSPTEDCAADGALGQPDLQSGTEFPYVSQRGKLRFPYGLASSREDGLAVADTANNRVLLFDSTSAEGSAEPVAVLAQPDAEGNGENRWQQVSRDTLCWPYGLCWSAGLLAIADSGNNRVVLWKR